MKARRIALSTLVALAALLGTSLSASASGPTGAIYTTVPDGSVVNANVQYNSKLEVYLDGGPGPNAPSTAGALDEGDYVFQVTDPSGGALLSQDPARCRVVHVNSAGVISALVNIAPATWTDDQGSVYPCHVQDSPDGVAGPSGHHDTNIDTDHSDVGAIVVQLMPILDTPNPGGEYKAWMTPLATYLAKGGNLNNLPTPIIDHGGNKIGYDRDPGFGGSRDILKTDNFKVLLETPVEQSTLVIEKVDAVTGQPVSGATFSVSPNPYACYSGVGNPGPLTIADDQATITVGSKVFPGDANTTDPGIIELANVCAPETYLVTETAAPPGYILDSTPVSQTVGVGATVTFTLADTQDTTPPACVLPPNAIGWQNSEHTVGVTGSGSAGDLTVYAVATDAGTGITSIGSYILPNGSYGLPDGSYSLYNVNVDFYDQYGNLLGAMSSTDPQNGITFSPQPFVQIVAHQANVPPEYLIIGFVVGDAAGNSTPSNLSSSCDPYYGLID